MVKPPSSVVAPRRWGPIAVALLVVAAIVVAGPHPSGAVGPFDPIDTVPASVGMTAADVAVDGAGNVFVADRRDHAVYRIDAATAAVTTVAGGNGFGFSGDGGSATAAQLATPRGLTVDGAGHLYIADADNFAIRRVDAGSGIITTVAGGNGDGYSGDGGAATAAQLSSVRGLAIDGAGHLYVADRTNAAVRRVDAGSGVITTVAGGNGDGYSGDGLVATAARLDAPSDVVVDGAGHLHIADADNAAVRRVDAGSGAITTVAGGNDVGYSGDGGPATAAQLSLPRALALDADGHLYIADANAFAVRRVDAGSAVITTVAGGNSHGPAGDGGPASQANLSPAEGLTVDSAGTLHIADGGNDRVRRVRLDGVAPTAMALSPRAGVTITRGGHVTVAFTCTDDVHVASCTGAVGGVPVRSGQAIDTSAAGGRTLTVTAVDGAGNVHIDSRTFTVAAPEARDEIDPSASIASPVRGAVVTQGAALTARFSCADDVAVASCVATVGGTPVASGARLDTGTVGLHFIRLQATDASGNDGFDFSAYQVVAAPPACDQRLRGAFAAANGFEGMVARLYMAIFRRQPDPEGHAYWVGRLRTGTPLQEVALFFTGSNEFVTRYQNLDDGQFVDTLYRNTLCREPDASGRGYWQGQLAGGLSRGEVLMYFSESAEFKTRTGSS